MQTSGSPSIFSHTDRLVATWQDFLLLVGRVLVGFIFINSGWRKLMDMQAFASTMPRRDLPVFLGYVAPPVEFIGGICLVLGLATRYASLVTLLFIIIATFSSHRYWSAPEAQMANQSSHFWKNVSMMGGTVLLFITGAGRYSLDWMFRRKG